MWAKRTSLTQIVRPTIMPINVIVLERAAIIGTSALSLENVPASLLIVIHYDSHEINLIWYQHTGCCCLGRCCHPVVGRQSVAFLRVTWRQHSPLSLPLAYCRGLLLSMLLKLWLRRLRLEDPGLLETPLPAAETLEGPGNLEERGWLSGYSLFYLPHG